ncbi:MAG: signal peptide peptidase SppA [Candidatus Marinimicrobia bacterium]|nr:signal peptide peptidase SppA [Candidatus Neomarinimicrobiota bacterium]
MKRDKILSLVIIIFVILFIIALYAGLNKQEYATDTAFNNRDKIALVELKGTILSADKISEQLEKYRERNDVKALVLRINSPGGGVAASQEIYEAVKKFRNSGKPVVASIASVGASGGYYAAIGASKIMANPGSITASIGVIATFPVVDELLDLLKVEYKTLKTGEYKDTGSPFRKFTKSDSLEMARLIDDLYNQFLDAIVTERGIEKNHLKKIADGRILTGLQAFKAGLIDTLGTREDAINLAAALAHLENPKLLTPDKKKVTMFDLLFEDLNETKALLNTEPAVKYLLK